MKSATEFERTDLINSIEVRNSKEISSVGGNVNTIFALHDCH